MWIPVKVIIEHRFANIMVIDIIKHCILQKMKMYVASITKVIKLKMKGKITNV